MKIGGPLPRWAKLAVCLGLGVALVVAKPLIAVLVPVPHWLEVVLEVLRDLGIALMVASALAFTFERWFVADLREDAFKAALGYIPPKVFKHEIRELLRNRFICERHVMRFLIEELEGCIRLTMTIERTLRNISSTSAPVRAYLHIDEWGSDAEASRLVECYMLMEDGRRIDGKPVKLVPEEGPRLKSQTDEKHVSPQKTVSFFSKCSEVKRRNDEINFFFGAATVNPEIHIVAPATIKCVPGFGTASETKVRKDKYGESHYLEGTYFPGQTMRLRWWPANFGNPAHSREVGALAADDAPTAAPA